MIQKKEIFIGCMLGGAVGDALGAPVEFMSLSSIRSKYGKKGLTQYDTAYGRKGAITDDTQMALFTAEGLILAKKREEYRQENGLVSAVYHAYLRWLSTQSYGSRETLIRKFGSCSMVDGILSGFPELHSNRAPGNSCLSSLMSGRMGTMKAPINDSKGCGGIMRIAPVGLAFPDTEKAFRIGCECAAITHGHPAGYLASGAMAAIISGISTGSSLTEAIDTATELLKKRAKCEECLQAIELALNLCHTSEPSPETVERLGRGWIAEEALAISLFCALVHSDDFSRGVLLAVNHSGDSDSTGCITGNILGTLLGKKAIPETLQKDLELGDLVEEIAVDLMEIYFSGDSIRRES